jgi:hypothetical protein
LVIHLHATLTSCFANFLRFAKACSAESARGRSNLLLLLAVAGYSLHAEAGLGLFWLQIVGASIVLASCFILGVVERDWRLSIWSALGYIALLVSTPLLHLHAFWFVTFLLSGVTRPLAFAVLSQWLLQALPLPLPVHGALPFLILAVGWFCVPGKFLNRGFGLAILTVICAAESFNFVALPIRPAAEFYRSVEYQFGIGETFYKLCGGGFTLTSGQIRSSIHKTSIPDSTPGLLVLDHDQAGAKPTAAEKFNFTQPLPWQGNAYLGDQFVLFWLRCDGFLASNLGGSLRPAGRPLLVARGIGKQHTLVEQRGALLLLADSDPLVNRLSPYQRHLLSYLLRVSPYGLLPLLLSAVACGMALLSPQKALAGVMIVLIVGIALTWSACRADHTLGGVRLVGRFADPHDPDRFSGVLRELVDLGRDWLFEKTQPEILYLQSGRSALWRGESLVIAEPAATVVINHIQYHILELPLANVRGVPDARQIASPRGISEGVLETAETRIIATGSPTRIDPSQWLKSSSQ